MTPAGRNFPIVMQLTAEVQRRLGKHDLGTRGGHAPASERSSGKSDLSQFNCSSVCKGNCRAHKPPTAQNTNQK
jgi:hypothetical protein